MYAKYVDSCIISNDIIMSNKTISKQETQVGKAIQPREISKQF